MNGLSHQRLTYTASLKSSAIHILPRYVNPSPNKLKTSRSGAMKMNPQVYLYVTINRPDVCFSEHRVMSIVCLQTKELDAPVMQLISQLNKK